MVNSLTLANAFQFFLRFLLQNLSRGAQANIRHDLSNMLKHGCFYPNWYKFVWRSESNFTSIHCCQNVLIKLLNVVDKSFLARKIHFIRLYHPLINQLFCSSVEWYWLVFFLNSWLPIWNISIIFFFCQSNSSLCAAMHNLNLSPNLYIFQHRLQDICCSQ